MKLVKEGDGTVVKFSGKKFLNERELFKFVVCDYEDSLVTDESGWLFLVDGVWTW